MLYNSKNIHFAKHMRSNMTKEELILWNIFRAKRFHGLKFKRQVLIGNYIVDFLCDEKKVIIEVDGGQHNQDINIKNDTLRSKYLESKGYKVLRLWNNEVLNNIDGVYLYLENELLN